MTTTTIPQFRGDYSIELDNGLYCAMHGAYSMYKGNGKPAEFKTLAGAMKFLATQGKFPVEDAAGQTTKSAEPAIEEVEYVNAGPVAKITEIAATRFSEEHYIATVFVDGGYQFIGKGDELSEDDVRTLLTQRFPGVFVAANDTAFAQKLTEMVDAN